MTLEKPWREIILRSSIRFGENGNTRMAAARRM
jgi:hypothetical protein